MAVNGLGGFKCILLCVRWRSNSDREIQSRVTWLLRDHLDVGAEFGGTLEHWSSPLANIKIACWVEQTYDCPSHRFEALLDGWVELANLNYEVDWCMNVFIRMLAQELDT